jgi:hypothetical protein
MTARQELLALLICALMIAMGFLGVVAANKEARGAPLEQYPSIELRDG